ncbi:nickel pincer cofactor biosynthesis protein LarB [Desulfatibacillum aliphaticivorans]|uniref:nickel pincer cofactor biosynthesis protein LarB n=1 Tax=Desulfatibacillum aliphaticivorans TaxID=218208 RepID=UPI000420350D|nr:nickel pincer cofactor biosynthesis protein LarB [Desulfatibacillum aliphaticivorans]
MNPDFLKKILDGVAAGDTPVEQAMDKLRHFSHEDLGFAHVDHHRGLRKGFPEVIFGQGKTAEQICGIMEKMAAQDDVILVTRVDREKAHAVLKAFPEAEYHAQPRMIMYAPNPIREKGRGEIVALSAGTSDIPVAMEAVLTARAMGNRVRTIFDVGVAGLHRLYAHREILDQASVLVVVAGMEGALPSVVAGLVPRPVIAVPTSVGYGTSFGGLTALLSMLNSCASNVAVVNIDNGFGAGYMASMINMDMEREIAK